MQKEKIMAQWNSVYTQFDGKRDFVWKNKPTDFFIEKTGFLKSHGIKKILDAGCGDGRNLTEFAKQGFEVTGIDISDIALKKCAELTKNMPNVKLVQCALEEINFKPETFDAILCDFVMTHIKKPEKVIKEFHEKLKPKGFLLIEFLSDKDPEFGKGKKINDSQFIVGKILVSFYSKKKVKEMLKGFKIIEIKEQNYIDPGHGSNYPRNKEHEHYSLFVFAAKQ